MKTLPISDTPQVLVLFSDDMEGVALRVGHEGFQTTHAVLKESSDNGGLLLASSFLKSNQPNGINWYKVVVFVSSFQIFSTGLLRQLSDLTRPLLVVVPVITSVIQNPSNDKLVTNNHNQLLAIQSILLNQVVSSLSSSCILLVDGLAGNQGIVSSNVMLVQSIITSSQAEVKLPVNLSLISQKQLLDQVLQRLTAPQLGSSTILVSEVFDGQQIYQIISKNLEQCYQHKVVLANFYQPPPVNIPPVKTMVLSADNAIMSELVGTTKSPRLQQDCFSQVIQQIKNRLDAWANIQEQLSSEKVINDRVETTSPTSSPPASPQLKSNLPKLSEDIKLTQDQSQLSTTPAPPIPNFPPQPSKSDQIPTQSQLDTQLASIFAKKRVIEKKGHQSNTKQIKSRIRTKSKRRRGLFVGGAVITGISLAILFFVGSYSLVASSLWRQVDSLVRDLRVDQVPTPPSSLSLLTNLLDWQNQFYDHFFDDSITERPNNSVELARKLLRLNLVDQNREGVINNIFSNLFVSENVDLLSVEQVVALQSVWLDLWQELLTDLQGIEPSIIGSLEKETTEIKSDQVILSNLSPHLSQLMGFDGPKTYAVIFQNTQELRSTGGFIQSLGTVTIKNGQITSTQAYSSYEIDKMLGGVVEPPQDLSSQLGEKQLYFRDSNWDPNFPNSAETMIWFLEKSLNTKLDGVLAITTAGLQDLLSATGPLALVESAQTISAQNLLERLESNSGVQGLTPNQPREYSTQVMSAVLEQLTKLTPEQTGQLLTSLSLGLKDANTLAFSKDSSIQQALVDLGWSGAVLSPPCPSPFGQKDCRIDPFYLNENNVGINKANQYVQRKNEASIRIDKSSLKYRLQISYENKTDVSSWPRGSYLAYARAYLPPNATQMKITIDGIEVPKKQLTTSTWENRSVVGFNFEVPIKSAKQLVIEFETPPLNGQDSYVFFLQKQPGVSLQQSQVEINLAAGQTPLQVSPGADLSGDKVVFSPSPNPHLLVGLSF